MSSKKDSTLNGLVAHLRQAKDSSRLLRAAAEKPKNQVLLEAERLLGERSAQVLKANDLDLKAAKKLPAAFVDRLLLNDNRIAQMREGLRQVASLSDPVGEVVEKRILPDGLKTSRVRSPLGVILMIYESRPNVAIEAFSLAFKAGNVMILRGGKESARTVEVLYAILSDALKSAGLPKNCLWGIVDPDRKIVEALLKQKAWIDVVVPRGGEGLISYVTENSEIPIIKNDRGLCHVYVHEDADLEMANRIVENAKSQRPSACNSMETLLVHSAVASQLLPKLFGTLSAHGVEWFTCPRSRDILKKVAHGSGFVHAAKLSSWDTEYLAQKMNCKVVKSLAEAIAHIERHGSKHSEAIVTASLESARKFQFEVDAAAVYWNASTRFTDGFELGLGGELGISTQKLHVRGPVGLRELTSIRWVMDGTGQVRKK